MAGALTPHDSEILEQVTELLLTHLNHLFWNLSRRDALEGQRLTVHTLEDSEVQFRIDEGKQIVHIERRVKPMSES